MATKANKENLVFLPIANVADCLANAFSIARRGKEGIVNLPGVKPAKDWVQRHFKFNFNLESLIADAQADAFAAGVQQAANAVLEHHLHGKDRTARGYYDAILSARDAKIKSQ